MIYLWPYMPSKVYEKLFLKCLIDNFYGGAKSSGFSSYCAGKHLIKAYLTKMASNNLQIRQAQNKFTHCGRLKWSSSRHLHHQNLVHPTIISVENHVTSIWYLEACFLIGENVVLAMSLGSLSYPDLLYSSMLTNVISYNFSIFSFYGSGVLSFHESHFRQN